VPKTPSNQLAWRSSVLRAALIGFVIGVGWIMVYAILRKTIRTKEDIRNVLNQNCIGVLPQVVFKKYRRKINTDIVLTNPLIGNDFLESLRLIRGSVRKLLADGEKVITVTSTAPEEGKSVVTVNLASIFARNSNKVLVVDCDLRNSGIVSLLEKEMVQVKENELFAVHRVESLGFDLLTFKGGEKNLQSVIRTSGLKKIFAKLSESYDLIFVDTPPCGIISDASIVAGASDALIYVVRQDAVMQNTIRSGINSMLETETKLLGCILNGALGGLGGYGNYYKYGGYNKYYRYSYSRKYGYGYGKKSARKDG
jgi:capsular exopolysaccharide synthesis family protein